MKLEEDMKVIKDAGGMGMLFQTLALPEGMAVSSADVIASLNEHLVQTLHVSYFHLAQNFTIITIIMMVIILIAYINLDDK